MTENENTPQFLSLAEKRAWLARIFRDTTGYYSEADKFKAMQEDNRMVNFLQPTAGNVRHAHYPQTVEEKHRFLTEAFGIPDETDGKEEK